METDVLDYEDVLVKTLPKTKLIEGFTLKQRYEFERGISIEDYAREKGIRI